MNPIGRDDTTGTDRGRPARSVRPALELVDLATAGVGLLGEPEWAGGDRTSKTLLKTESLRIVLTALRAGATMENEDPDEAMAIQGLHGTLTMELDGESTELRMGDLACLAGGDPWRITADSDSLLLLSVGRARSSVAPTTE